MAQLRRDYDRFQAVDTAVVVIGPDNARAFQTFWTRQALPFIGLPDPAHRVSSQYGQQVRLLRLGRLPAQIVVGKGGLIRYTHYGNNSMRDISDNGKLLSLLRRIDH